MATQKQVAEHLDLSTRRIRSLVDEKILPESRGRGGYDLTACRKAYIDYLRGLASGQIRVAGDEDYQTLIEREKYIKLKRENEIQAGKYLLKSDVERDTFTMARTVRDNILNIPTRVDAQLASIQDAHSCNVILTRELIQALEELSK